MLFLLLRTRLRYYRNYLRHHFDRMVWLEIGLIVIILLFLTVRSPADIGYSLKFLWEKDFPLRYAEKWVALLPIFYLSVEALALVTLRPTGEWQILGALPIHKTAITKYHLLRHLGKTFGLLLLGTLPFLIGNDSAFVKILRGFFALGILLLLQWAGFAQAYTLRHTHKKTPQKLLRWLPVEAAIILFLIGGASWLPSMFVGATSHALIAVLPIWSLALALLFYLCRAYEPGWIETQTSEANENSINRPRAITLSNKMGLTGTLILHDVQFLWRCKRSTFVWLLLAAIILAAAAFAQESAEAAYASSIVLEIIFSLLLINVLLVLFEREVKTVGLIRSLPIGARKQWRSRWVLAAGFMALPMLLPILIILFKFAVDAGFLFFLVMAIGVPAVFAALYCNAGFGLFPNTKYCGLLLNISLGLMVLFWFYMPFGTILLLGIAALWIGKSQRHFQLLEIQ
ncbi:MAG: hypothetical protein ACRENG_11635 [bacterium]